MCSSVFSRVFPCVWVFPTPSYHMLCNYHTSFRVTPTTHSLERSLTPPRRSLTPPRRASPTPEATTRKQRGDRDDSHHLNPQPQTLNKPTPAPHKSSTSRQPRRPRRPRRRPLGATTPLNTQKSSTYKQPGDLDDGQHTRPRPRTPSNTQIVRTIDTNHDQRGDPHLGQRTNHVIEHAHSPHHRHPPRPHTSHEPTTTHQTPTLWRSTHRRSRTGNAKARGADRSRGHPHLDQQMCPRHRTLLWNTPSTPTTASESTQITASRRAHNVEHTKSQPHRHQKRPRTGQHNDPILGQRMNHNIEHTKSQLHRQRQRPATTLTTTHTSASSYDHNLEHPYDPRHRQRQRPLASNATTTQQPAPRLWRKTLRRSR